MGQGTPPTGDFGSRTLHWPGQNFVRTAPQSSTLPSTCPFIAVRPAIQSEGTPCLLLLLCSLWYLFEQAKLLKLSCLPKALTCSEKMMTGASLVAQWLRVCLPMQGTRVRALVWEDPICRGATKPVSHSYWACAPQRERPRQWEAHATRWRVAPARRNWRKPLRRNEDPTQPKINKLINLKKFYEKWWQFYKKIDKTVR